MTKNNGGPAFARAHAPSPGAFGEAGQVGMTLRDYYAAHAPITMQDAMVAAGLDVPSELVHYHAIIMHRPKVMAAMAKLRGEYADAMLAERESDDAP